MLRSMSGGGGDVIMTDALRIRMLLAKMLDFESNNLLVQIRSLLIQKGMC